MSDADARAQQASMRNARSDWARREARVLEYCDRFVAKVRSMRSTAIALQRSGDHERLQRHLEQMEDWIIEEQDSEDGLVTRLEDLREVMYEMEQFEQFGVDTMSDRLRLARAMEYRCQP